MPKKAGNHEADMYGDAGFIPVDVRAVPGITLQAVLQCIPPCQEGPRNFVAASVRDFIHGAFQNGENRNVFFGWTVRGPVHSFRIWVRFVGIQDPEPMEAGPAAAVAAA